MLSVWPCWKSPLNVIVLKLSFWRRLNIYIYANHVEVHRQGLLCLGESQVIYGLLNCRLDLFCLLFRCTFKEPSAGYWGFFSVLLVYFLSWFPVEVQRWQNVEAFCFFHEWSAISWFWVLVLYTDGSCFDLLAECDSESLKTWRGRYRRLRNGVEIRVTFIYKALQENVAYTVIKRKIAGVMIVNQK